MGLVENKTLQNINKRKKVSQTIIKSKVNVKKYKLISLWPVFQQILLHKKGWGEKMCLQDGITNMPPLLQNKTFKNS